MSIASDETPKKKPTTGLPFHFKRDATTEQPIEKEDTGNGIIKWGTNNLYPQWLNGLFYSCAIHSGIIRSKVFFTVSGGLNYEGPDQDKWERMFSNGTSSYDLNHVAEQMAMDVELSNMMVLRGRWSLDRSHCSRIDLIPYETVREMIASEDIAVCPDWSDKNTGLLVYKPLDLLDRESFHFYVMFKTKPKQMIMDGQRKVQTGRYPLAPYIGGIKSIQTDSEIVNYSHSEIINNFAAGTILNLNNGRPKTREDRLKLEKRIKDASGTDAAGGTVVLFNNGKDNAATVEKLSGNDLNDRYITLSEDVRKNILLAHSVTSTTLFGLEAGGNFNASEMEIGYEIMKANYFDMRRRQILSLITEIAQDCNGIRGEITFNEVSLQTNQEVQVAEDGNEVSKALGEMSPLVANSVLQVLTVNEIRALASLGIIDGGDAPRGMAPAPTGDMMDTILSKIRMAQDQTESDLMIQEFSKIGRDKDGVMILSHQPVDVNDVEGSAQKFMEEFQKENFAIQNATLLSILGMISDGDSFDSISKSLGINPADLAKNYSTLQNGEYLDQEMKLTRKGAIELANNDASRMSIVYSYEKRPEVDGGDVIPGTRDFCRQLIGLNRVYTREEINSIPSPNAGEPNANVFLFRGGWLNTGTKNVPYCRHYWRQQIIFE